MSDDWRTHLKGERWGQWTTSESNARALKFLLGMVHKDLDAKPCLPVECPSEIEAVPDDPA